jgi:mRNA-degrading endonuclease RelE of RelBE toxin-antitoxin system
VKRVVWETAARADLRRLDRDTAMRILMALTRYQDSGEGDVKPLTDGAGLYSLRVGKWRVLFDLDLPVRYGCMASTIVARPTDLTH